MAYLPWKSNCFCTNLTKKLYLYKGCNMEHIKMFKEGAQIFKCGPIPGRYFYVSEFVDAIFKEYSIKYAGSRWPDTLFLFKDKRMVWVNDSQELRKAGREIFIKYILKKKTRSRLKTDWQRAVKKISTVEKKIGDSFLEDLSDNQLYDIWERFYDLIIAFWLPAVSVELGNYGADELFEEKLSHFIKNSQELSSVAEILTAPEKPSFYQKEEADLSSAKDLGWHARKYFWLRNSYNGVEELRPEFFAKRQKELPKNNRDLIDERLAGIKNKKKKTYKKYKFPREVKNIAKALSEGKEWQDERKKYIFIYTHYKELLLKEVSRRFNYNAGLLRNCSSREVMQILEKRGAHMIIEGRGNLFGFFMDPLKKKLVGEEAVFAWEKYVEKKAN